jgi:hypothetical protein
MRNPTVHLICHPRLSNVGRKSGDEAMPKGNYKRELKQQVNGLIHSQI